MKDDRTEQHYFLHLVSVDEQMLYWMAQNFHRVKYWLCNTLHCMALTVLIKYVVLWFTKLGYTSFFENGVAVWNYFL